MSENNSTNSNQQLLTELQRLREQVTQLETENRSLAQSMQKIKDALEQTVESRTAELLITNRKLQQEIAGHRQTQIALGHSEEKFRRFFEEARVALIQVDEAGTISHWNSGAEQLTGIPASEALGQYVWDVQYSVLPPERKTPARYELLQQMLQTALHTGQGTWLNKTIEGRFQHADGSVRITQQRIFPIKTGQGFRLGSISRDITEQVQSRRELAEERNLLRTLIDILPDHIYGRDKEIVLF
jgi:PAS domain S-box-containing protein